MGERASGLATDSNPSTPRATAEELGSEIAVVRGELDTLLSELDRRRHEALDVPLQLRRHAFGASLTALALLVTATGSVGLTIWRRRRRDRFGPRAGRLNQAFARMTAHPERVAAEPTIVGKILTAAATAAVAALVKKVLEGALERVMQATAEGTVASPPGPAAATKLSYPRAS
jgi:hypothetical protein